MNTKVTKYFDAQELYDDITLQAKIQGQAAADSISKEQIESWAASA